MRQLGTFKTMISLLAASAVGITGILTPQPAAAAGGRGVGTAIGIGLGAGAALMLLNEAAKAANQKPQAAPRSSGSGSTRSRQRAKTEDDDEEEVAAPKKSASEYVAEAKNHAAEEEARREIERSRQMERDRNVELAVQEFIDYLLCRHGRLRERDSHDSAQFLCGNPMFVTRLAKEHAAMRSSQGDNINQITAGQVRSDAEDAYGTAQLNQYDRLAGELWTRDRLLVQILREARPELEPYFVGVGARGPSREDLRTVFKRSARTVYNRALELSEIVGVSHSFDRFIHTIYENSDRADEHLWTVGADGRYERVASRLIERIPHRQILRARSDDAADPLGLQQQFQFRFRARRAIYDCLSANYPRLASGQTEPKTIQTAMPEPSPVRGAQLGEAAGAAGALPATTLGGSIAQAPPAVPAQAPVANVWVRTQGFAENVCRDMIEGVARQAASGEIRPVSARWNSAGSMSGGAGAPLEPIRLSPADQRFGLPR